MTLKGEEEQGLERHVINWHDLPLRARRRPGAEIRTLLPLDCRAALAMTIHILRTLL
jgi:hypothetical protein